MLPVFILQKGASYRDPYFHHLFQLSPMKAIHSKYACLLVTGIIVLVCVEILDKTKEKPFA
jgi:hypothetical protein